VGVEFLSRSLANRDKRSGSSETRATDSEESPPTHPRQQPPGKVPTSARAARTVADAHIHAADHEHRSFSSEESMAELRELAISAGGTVAGEMQQRR